jgi:hypothetical protein
MKHLLWTITRQSYDFFGAACIRPQEIAEIPDTHAEWHAFAAEHNGAAMVAAEALASSHTTQKVGLLMPTGEARQQLENQEMAGHYYRNSHPIPMSASYREASKQQSQQWQSQQQQSQQHFSSTANQGQHSSAPAAALMSHGDFAVDLNAEDIKGVIHDDCLVTTSYMEIKVEEDCNANGGHYNDSWWLQPQSLAQQEQSNIHRAHNRNSSSSLPSSAKQNPYFPQPSKHPSVSFGDLTEDAILESSVNPPGNTM